MQSHSTTVKEGEERAQHASQLGSSAPCKGRASKTAKQNSKLNRKQNTGQVWWSHLQHVESEAERVLVLGQPRRESKILSKRKEEWENWHACTSPKRCENGSQSWKICQFTHEGNASWGAEDGAGMKSTSCSCRDPSGMTSSSTASHNCL